MYKYLFTTPSGTPLHYIEAEFGEYKNGDITPGDVALLMRKSIQEMTNLKTVAWALMGGDNEEPKITNKKIV